LTNKAEIENENEGKNKHQIQRRQLPEVNKEKETATWHSCNNKKHLPNRIKLPTMKYKYSSRHLI
jgi:hypothetical protein